MLNFDGNVNFKKLGIAGLVMMLLFFMFIGCIDSSIEETEMEETKAIEVFIKSNDLTKKEASEIIEWYKTYKDDTSIDTLEAIEGIENLASEKSVKVSELKNTIENEIKAKNEQEAKKKEEQEAKKKAEQEAKMKEEQAKKEEEEQAEKEEQAFNEYIETLQTMLIINNSNLMTSEYEVNKLGNGISFVIFEYQQNGFSSEFKDIGHCMVTFEGENVIRATINADNELTEADTNLYMTVLDSYEATLMMYGEFEINQNGAYFEFDIIN